MFYIFKPNLFYFFSYSVLKVREDPVFRREGSDIHVDAVLSITQVMVFDEEILEQYSCNYLVECFWDPLISGEVTVVGDRSLEVYYHNIKHLVVCVTFMIIDF